jgi:stage II sporulation protein D
MHYISTYPAQKSMDNCDLVNMMKQIYRSIAVTLLTALILALFCASPAKCAEDPVPMVRIGLYWGDTALEAANLQNAVGSGFAFGYFDEERSFVPVGETQETAITMIKDWNMYLVGGKYQTDSVSGADVVGCYHIRLADVYPDFASAEEAAKTFDDAFPAYHEDNWYVCVGSYTGQSAGAAAAEARGLTGTSMTCSNRCVTVVATGTTRILFQFDCGERRSLAVMPMSAEGEKPTTWFKGYRYYGAFQYQRIDGKDMNVVNFLSMDDYIKGVIPYEMNSAWPVEALKAQAVAARTYTAAHLNHHSSNGFDLCCEVDCQAYRGVNASDENSDRAVDETSGVYMTYEGEYVNAFYFSSDGGATEDCENVFNNALPYLRGKPDPYEAYVKTGRDDWRFVYSADEITAILRAKNYRCAQIVSITPTYTNMGNIYSLKFTDANGVNWVFSRFRASTILYSSTYQKYTYSQRFTVTDADLPVEESSFYVAGGEGINLLPDSLYLVSGNGSISMIGGAANATVLSADGTETVSLRGYTSGTITASSYLIKGSGWGHNVGMSQYGAKAMAELGMSYLDILNFYYEGADIG